MAKSLRAKTKVRMRGIKRAAVYQPVVDARLQRLSEKLTKKVEEKVEEKKEGGEEMIVDEQQVAEKSDQMEVEVKKVSSKSKDKKKNNKKKSTKTKNSLVFNTGSKRTKSRK